MFYGWLSVYIFSKAVVHIHDYCACIPRVILNKLFALLFSNPLEPKNPDRPKLAWSNCTVGAENGAKRLLLDCRAHSRSFAYEAAGICP